jgi:hypothetical protein
VSNFAQRNEVIYEGTFEVKRFLGQTSTVTPKRLKSALEFSLAL